MDKGGRIPQLGIGRERRGAEGVVKNRSLASERMMAEEGGKGLERRGSGDFMRSASNML